MKYLILIALLTVSCAQKVEEESSGRKYVERPVQQMKPTPIFKVGDCIFGGSGIKGRHQEDSGYKVVTVQADKNQYLLRCLTAKNCTSGMKTWWITEFDKWMVKVDCTLLEPNK